jgi:hypothetical protein
MEEPPAYEEVFDDEQEVDADAEELQVDQLRTAMVSCKHCNNTHMLYDCPKLEGKTVEQQRDFFRSLHPRRPNQNRTNTSIRQLEQEEEYLDDHQDEVDDQDFEYLDYREDNGRGLVDFQRGGW